MQLRICSPQLGLSPRSVLGGEVYDYEILTGLSKLGIKVDIILPKSKPTKTSNNWQIIRLPFSHIPAYLFNLLEIPYLFKLYRRGKFSLIRLHAPYFTGIGAWFFRLFNSQVKLIAVYHQARTGFPFNLINQLFIRQWDAIITDSYAAKKSLINRYSLAANKIYPIHNGTPHNLKPTSKNKSLVSRYKLNGHTVLLFMGLLIERKNPIFLLHVFKELKRQTPNKIKLIICGSGPLKNQLAKIINKYQLQNEVILHSPVFGKAKQNLYSVADIFVHPAIHEGFPLVVLEAMACGLPIVISKGYSAAEAVTHGKNGYLASTNNKSDWVKVLKKLILDKKLRAAMGKQSFRRNQQEFTWEQAAKKHQLLFDQITKQ